MDRSWIRQGVRRLCNAHTKGVAEFMRFVRRNCPGDTHVLCPCRSCLNQEQQTLALDEAHLLMNGMACTYDRWIHHGEPLHAPQPEHDQPAGEEPHVDHQGHDVVQDDLLEDDALQEADGNEDDRIPDLFKDLYNSKPQGGNDNTIFAELIEEANRSASDGGTFSRFAFTVKMLHVKSYYRISNVAFNAILRILTLQYPKSDIPRSYDEALSIIKRLGLGYDSIHVCPNNCVLFRKQLAKLDNCPKCKASRWKDADGRRRIPEKVLRHFPLIPRLQRMFISKQQSEEVQWHKLKRQPVANELSHLADGKAWKDFDDKFKDFAADARNIRLGIATDGFNPFGNMSNSYSMWPVFVVPYNLPPWACMDQSNFMMSLLIPGPDSPGKDFDVFMEPLVEELLLLWKGVRSYDALSPDKFDLRAAIIWCIHDFPALHTLSGRITAGYQACVRCDKDPCSKKIRNKICFIGHRRWLPHHHRWRRSKDFNGEAEPREKPAEFTKEELMEQLEKVKHVRPGKLERKRKREDGQCWSRRSVLWDLPYWGDLKLRHNLDVMHIEKNILDNLLGTFMNIDGKTKDTVNSRLDLEDMGIRADLHLHPVEGGESFEMPEAWYTMTKEEKIRFCEFIRAIRFLDGYAANLAKCVSHDGCKLQGLKTHDCHILLQRILPAGLRGIMDKEIYEAVAELGNFFRELCCKTLKLDVLERLQKEIPVILCKLEKIFPPAFFTVMVHLAIHLPEEAMLRGPVQYGWMYPIERRLLTCKRSVRNTTRPEGSIAEAYVVDECLTFCSRYFDDVETRFNRPGRNKARDDSHTGDVSVFKHGVNFLGASQYLEAEAADYDKMVWYVLRSCPEVLPYIEVCKAELKERDSRSDVDKWLMTGFAKWFQNHIGKLHLEKKVSADLFALACQPDRRVRIYSACIVDGVCYHTVDREKNRSTQNSGILTEGEHDKVFIDFYGQLRSIVSLQYNSSEGVHRSVILFRCDWFHVGGKKNSGIREDRHFKSINTGRFWYKSDPFILTTQATKVFYMTRMAKKAQLFEAPLTEIEKVRAQTMMRNNRIFQSLGIGALVSMIRNSNDGPTISGITNDDSTSAITHGESSDYNPRDDEVIDEEEVNDIVVEENVKAKKTSRRKKCGVKKPRRRPEASTTIMAPGRVFAVAPEASKKFLEEAEAPPARVTRQKAKEIAVDIQQCQAVVSSPCRDDGFVSTDEGSCVRMDLSLVDQNQQLNSAIIAEEEPEHDKEKRKKRKGAGLERMTKALGTKVKIHIAEGMKRPQEPVRLQSLPLIVGLSQEPICRCCHISRSIKKTRI